MWNVEKLQRTLRRQTESLKAIAFAFLLTPDT
jgi:hypothetical protein